MLFKLHPKLEQDTIQVTELPMSRVLLMNDQRFPWLILVPRVAGITELYDLSVQEQEMLMAEACALAKILKTTYAADKVNIANLGNIVPQFHLHIVARNKADAAWPAPVWGFQQAVCYSADMAEAVIAKVIKLIPKQLI